MATWVPFSSVVVLNSLPVFVVYRYDNWIACNPAKANRLEELVGEVRTIFREAVQANPKNVMDAASDTVPAVALHFALAMVSYAVFMEIGDLI